MFDIGYASIQVFIFATVGNIVNAPFLSDEVRFQVPHVLFFLSDTVAFYSFLLFGIDVNQISSVNNVLFSNKE